MNVKQIIEGLPTLEKDFLGSLYRFGEREDLLGERTGVLQKLAHTLPLCLFRATYRHWYQLLLQLLEKEVLLDPERIKTELESQKWYRKDRDFPILLDLIDRVAHPHSLLYYAGKLSEAYYQLKLYSTMKEAVAELESGQQNGASNRLEQLIQQKPAPLEQGLVTVTEQELVAAYIPPTKWIVQDILPAGLTLLCGKAKVGKSWLVLGLAKAVANGAPALGNKRTEQGEVLYLALEDTRARIKARLEKASLGNPSPNLHFATSCPAMDQDGLAFIEGWLLEHPGAKLVIIDTLARVRGGREKDGILYDEDYTTIAKIKALADRYGIAIIVVHHTRKLGADDALDLVSGTIGLTGAADTIMILKRDRKDQFATLTICGRDLLDQEEMLRFDPDTCCWFAEGDAEKIRMTAEQQELVSVLEGNPNGLSLSELCTLLGKSKPAVGMALHRAIKAGFVKRTGHGYYTLTEPCPCCDQIPCIWHEEPR